MQPPVSSDDFGNVYFVAELRGLAMRRRIPPSPSKPVANKRSAWSVARAML